MLHPHASVIHFYVYGIDRISSKEYIKVPTYELAFKTIEIKLRKMNRIKLPPNILE